MAHRVPIRDGGVVLQALLAELLALRPSGFAPSALDAQQQFAIAATYFLLDVPDSGLAAPSVSVERFVTYTLGRLLQQLSRVTERQRVAYAGQVHGRIDWPSTIKARYSEDYDPSRYVCREVHRRYDTLENQLLKYVVEEIRACLLAVPRVIREGHCYYPAAEGGEHHPDATAIRLGRMETALNRARYHVRYREITRPLAPTAEHLRSAESSRQEEYAEVAQVYRRYRQMLSGPARWQDLARAGRRVLPLPARADAEGRLWIQVGTAVVKHELL